MECTVRGRAFGAAAVLLLVCTAHAANYGYVYVRHPATAINAHGIALINCDCASSGGRAFVYRDKVITQLEPPLTVPASDIQAVAINNRDQILVYSRNTATGYLIYFLYDLDAGTYRPLGNRGNLISNPAFKDFRLGRLIALTDDDEVLAGFSGYVRSNDPSGVTLAGGVAYGKPAIGEAGSVVRPAELGEFTQAPKPPCASTPTFTAMNDRHQITGSCVLARDRGKPLSTGFIISDGAFTEVAAPGGRNTRLTAINNAGIVVGYFEPSTRRPTRQSFVFDGTRFNNLLEGTSQHPGPDVATALGISDTGLIAGSTVNVDEIGFIATPGAGKAAPPADIAAAHDVHDHAEPHSAPASQVRQTPRASTGFVTGNYYGRNASVKNGVLTFSALGAAGGAGERTLSFSGLLPVGRRGTASAQIWIARDAQGYVTFALLPSGTVTGMRLNEKMGEQMYERARSAQGER